MSVKLINELQIEDVLTFKSDREGDMTMYSEAKNNFAIPLAVEDVQSLVDFLQDWLDED